MELSQDTSKKLLTFLLKDFISNHSVSSLAKELNLSRVGIWKILKKLENHNYIVLEPIGPGKTSTFIIKLNWNNLLIERLLSFYLLEEAVINRKWQVNFADLENEVNFLIVYGSILSNPKQANDIDILCIANKNKFIKIQTLIDKIQKTQSKKIHTLSFTENEFKLELNRNNKAFLEAIKKGIILFGQDNFIKFLKNVKNG